MSFDVAEVENPFPSPPERYKLFTDRNVSLLGRLREATETKGHEPLPEGVSQAEQLPDENLEGTPENLLVLEKPRFDWIEEGGRFNMYANVWKIVDGQPIAPEAKALNYLVPTAEGDKRASLHKMLKTILHSYYALLGAVSEHIPLDDMVSTSFQEDAMFMSEIAYSFMDTINSFRSLQARETFEQLLLKQLRDRREETRMINEKCDGIEQTLDQLRALASEATQVGASSSTSLPAEEVQPLSSNTANETLALQWADEVE